MKKRNIISRLIAIIITISVFFCNNAFNTLSVSADENSRLAAQYISEVKVFYADSLQTAKSFAAVEGFYLCPENINEGSNTKIQAYLGYKTTEDEGDAITDLSLLDMKNSHYQEMTYKEFLDKHMSDFADQAARIMILVNELRKQYKAGSPNALAAYDSLNMIYVDDTKSHTDTSNLLGEYILKKADTTFFQKYIQRGNAKILSTIVNMLGNAVTDYEEDGSTWVTKARKSAIVEMYKNADSAEKNQYNTWYRDPAINLIREINDFAETYMQAVILQEEFGDTFGYAQGEGLSEDSTLDEIMQVYPDCRIPEYINALKTYEFLDSVIYQEEGEEVITDASYLYEEDEDEDSTIIYTERKTLAEYFMDLAAAPGLELHPENVYHLVSSMTSAQRTALNLGGLGVLAKSLIMIEDYESQRSELIEDTIKQLKELGFADGKIYLWEGVDTSLYNKMVVETSDKIEAEKSGLDLINSVNKAARDAASDLTLALQIIDISLLGLSGIFMIAQAIVGTSLWAAGSACFASAGAAMAAGLIGSAVFSAILGALACAAYILSILVLIASLAYLVYTLLDSAGVFDVLPETDYTTIPTIMYHVRTNSSGNYVVRYEAVESNADVDMFLIPILAARDTGDWDTLDNIIDRLIDAEDSAAVEEMVRFIVNHNEEEIREKLAGYYNNKFRTDANDMASFQGVNDRWTTLFYSKAPASGQPIKVVPGESFLKILNNTPSTPEGCRPVTLISGSEAHDVNSIEIDGVTGTPRFMYIIKDPEGQKGGEEEPETPEPETEEPETVEPVVPEPESETAEPESETAEPETPEPESETKESESESAEPESETKEPESEGEESEVIDGQYISRVRLSHAAKKEDAINSLKKDGFLDYFDINLTPYSGYTYLGYQYGSKNSAVTDLRLSSQPTDSIIYGDSTYGRAGIDTYAMTASGLSLFATYSKSAGTPIKKISIETKRLPLGSGPEPVCLFSGGNAVDLKHDWTRNAYFSAVEYLDTYDDTIRQKGHETKQTELEDGYYIYFWPETEYKATDKNSQPPYISGFSYFLAMDADRTSGSLKNDEYMVNFAAANNFELVMDGGYPAKMMSKDAGTMNPVYCWQDCEGGAMGHDWRYDLWHYMSYSDVSNFSDGAQGYYYDDLMDIVDKEDYQTAMYFGVSYTYNPYRAITGISGIITPYTETTRSLRFTGLTTPAGTMLASNVSVMGNPVTQAGISLSYFGYTNMSSSFYVNRNARQRSDLDWLSKQDTEVLSRYLLSAGPSEGREPLKRGDVTFVTHENPGEVSGYKPLCDMRTPGDYEHPMNFALDTTNLGSEYLYIYLKNDAGGRAADKDENNNTYNKKHYIAGVFCGTGKTPEEAINNLYRKATENWPYLAAQFPDISKTPLVTEFDEILPIDLSDQNTWYTQTLNDTKHCDPKDDEWVYGNTAANLRWGHDVYNDSTLAVWTDSIYHSNLTPDEKEKTRDYAYIGVVRTRYSNEEATIEVENEDGTKTTKKQIVRPVYALLKYYSEESSPTLHVGEVICTLAGGPVKSKEGTYYLYYSNNEATASFSAPVTEIKVDGEEFINGYNSCFCCKSSDRVGYQLPAYSTLRMRTDEYRYIHTKYDMEDLPYIERIYIGVGNNKKEAFADLIGTTNASAAATVNCNYNSLSDKWVAIGYRRTNVLKDAIRDVFLYSGDNPAADLTYKGYLISETKKQGKVTTVFKEGDVKYKLVRHNLKSGAEDISLNYGAGGTGLYMYYTTTRFAYDKSAEAEVMPINNFAFGYGDISPLHATKEQLAEVFGETMYGMSTFDPESYADPIWEYVIGVEDSPAKYKLDGTAGFPMSLNYGQLPMMGNEKRHTRDMRVAMYVDRGNFSKAGTNVVKYNPRPNAALTGAGYYSTSTEFGIVYQNN